MAGEVSVNINCNYEDFLKGMANVKKEAELAVLEQRKRDQAERDARLAADRTEREARRAAAAAEREAERKAERDQREQRRSAEREKYENARNERRDKENEVRESQRQARQKEREEREAARAAAAAQREEERTAQREKEVAARNERRAIELALREQQKALKEKERAEREAQREAERAKQEAARKEKKDSEAAWRETQRQIKEKEKAEKEAQKAAQEAKEKKFGIAQGFLSGGLTGGISAIGAAFGPEGQIAAELANKLIESFQKAVQEAKELRNLSYATDISTGELRKMAVVAEQAGISVSQFAHAVFEFNKNMANAKIRGGELNNLLNKLGVSQKDLESNSYDYNRALRDLAKAHRAGTDAATLAYYGNLMFGSSFESMLPLIKRGTGEIDRAGQGIYKTSETATNTLADLSDKSEKFWSNYKNVMSEGFAWTTLLITEWVNVTVTALAKTIALVNPTKAAETLNATAVGGPEVRRFLAKSVSLGLPEDKQKEFDKRMEELLTGESGVKLTPVGLQTAQGASAIQQMGGGDIVSAVAFSPAQATAEATQKTAENTAKTNELLERTQTNVPMKPAPRR